MDILILIGQRECRYEGEYAPEVVECIDEYANGDNPDFLIEARGKAVSSKDFDALAVIKVRISDASVTEALYPSQKAIDGEVISVESP